MKAVDVPYKFQEIWAAAAAAGYVNTPIPDTSSGAAASQSLGFPPITAQPIGSGGIPPDIADFNGILQYATAWSQWFQAGAPLRYDATFQTNIAGYPEGAIVESAGTPGKFWISTIDDNTGNPDTGSTNWRPWPWFQTTTTGTATLTRVASWTSYQVSVSAVVTLPTAAAAQGAVLAFTASGLCTITSAGGTFLGGVQTGLSSITMPTNAFLMILSDGTHWRIMATSMQGGSLLNWQVFSASGTYTPTPGMRFVIFEVQGGGASGGGTQTTGSGEGAAGGGGGAGSYAKGAFLAASVGASQAVTVGPAVSGTLGSNGTNGNASSVGALVVTPGGLAGSVGVPTTSFVASTAGGGPASAATGGNIVAELGSAAAGGLVYAATNCGGGAGAASHFGAGGQTRANGDGTNAVNFGSGGGGGQATQSTGNTTGGSGAGGYVIAWEYS